MSTLPPVYVELRAIIGQFEAKIAAAKKSLGLLGDEADVGATKFQKFRKYAAAAAGVGLGLMALAAYKATKAAADYQTKLEVVYSTTGEVRSKTYDLGQQLLDLGTQVGYSGTDMAKAFYYVASGGYHAAAGVEVLKAAAQGAKIENSDLSEVAHALTGVLAEYHMKASEATRVTSGMTAAVGHGMMTFNDLALALPRVGSRAAAAHVSVQELLGAMATMTRTGLPASVAATYLGQTIGHLEAPSAKARTEMKGLGIDATQLAKTLGSGSGHGLTDAVSMLYKGITTHLTPSGLVAVKTFEKSKGSAADYKKMLANLPDSMQTVVGAVATMSGGVKGLQGTLMLGGKNLKTFKGDVKAVADAMHHSGKNVTGWNEKQKTLNQKVDEFKAGLKNLQIEIGTDLLPVATKFLGWLATAAKWMEKHKTVVEVLAAVIGVVLVAALVEAAIAMVAATWEIILIVAAVALVVAGIIYLWTHWKQIWGWIKDKATEVGNAIGSFFSNLWDGIKSKAVSAWNSIKDALSSAWNHVASFFSGAWHKVTDPIVHAWHNIESETKRIWNGVLGFLKKWWPLLLAIFAPMIVLFMSIWIKGHKKIEAAVKTVWNGIKSFFKMIWNNIKGNAKADWNAIKKYIIGPIEWVWHRIEAVLGFIWRIIKAAWHNIKRNTEADWNAVKRIFSTTWNAIKGVVEHAIGYLYHHVIQKKFNEIKNWFHNIGSWWTSVGRNIVNGIVNGITSVGHLIGDKLKSLANDALNGVKSFLGINSPSRVFSEQVGRWIPAGVADGIDKGHTAVRNSVGRLASATADAWRNPGTFGGSSFGGFNNALAPAAFSPAYGQPMTLNLNIKGEVDGQEVFAIVQRESLRWGKQNGRPAFTLGASY